MADLKAKTPEDFGEMYKEFLEKGPSALDIEIRSLGKSFKRKTIIIQTSYVILILNVRFITLGPESQNWLK